MVNVGHLANLGRRSTITSDLSNQGYLDVTGGTLVTLGDLVNTGVITNNATIQVGAAGSGWLTNASTVVLGGGVLSAGAIANRGTISGHGTLASAINNGTLVSATNGLLSITGAATGTGTYRAEAGATLSFNGGGQVSSLFNAGATLRLAGGVLTNTSMFNNAGGVVEFAGGGYQASRQFTNTGWLVGAGSFNSAAALVNEGTIDATGSHALPLVLNADLLNTATGQFLVRGGALQVSGVFTNNGTLQVISGVGTYNLTVNNGAWLTDLSASTYQDTFLITTNGYVAAAAGDRYVFKADLFNQSTNNVLWNTMGTNPGTNTLGTGVEFVFSGSGLSETQTFTQSGLLLTGGFGAPTIGTTDVQDVTGTLAGFANNFAVGELWLTNTTLVLAAAALSPFGTNALFVNDLLLFGTAQLVISNDVRVYFVNSNDWSLANITLLGNAQIHQFSSFGEALATPEPSVLLMWLCGGLAVWVVRRRRNRSALARTAEADLAAR